MAALSPEQLQAAAGLILPLLTDLVREMRRDEQGGRIDHRAMGGPPEWDSTKDEGFREWSIKLQAWLVNQDSKAPHVVEARDLGEGRGVHQLPRRGRVRYRTRS